MEIQGVTAIKIKIRPPIYDYITYNTIDLVYTNRNHKPEFYFIKLLF